MDHDFYCLQKSKNLDFEDNFDRGLQQYLGGDWLGAQTNFTRCKEISGFEDGPLKRMWFLMEKTKSTPPDNWAGAFNWDEKPIPPDVEFNVNDEEEALENQEQN